ncbi:MAG: lipopolysaccharide heptosyltransferase I [Gammaproteobacteria bacterium]|nr:lipopolysaccharide heptosyltransferase I [Gammaproteobacteria bacterium]
MKILIIKTSSMGDLIHTFPALTDAGRMVPGITFDWVVEEGFAEIPTRHPLVNKVIPVALRRWRKYLFTRKTWQEWNNFRHSLRATSYDLIIDAQGLLKSAFISLNAKGKRIGFNAYSARESLAAFFYKKTFFVEKKQHAILRLRQLFSQSLGYSLPETAPDYGLDRACLKKDVKDENYLVFLHGTTWQTKHWSESAWIELTKIVAAKGLKIKLPWGNKTEEERARRIAAVSPEACVLARQDLVGIAKVLAGAKAVVAVDTGLLHLAAGLGIPAVSLYGPTNPMLSGALGASQVHLSASFACAPCLRRECIYGEQKTISPPCFATLTPLQVWAELEKLL